MQHQLKSDDFPIGKKIFARYTDEWNDLQINFIPMYVVDESENLYIGTKNDLVGTHKGYFQLQFLTGGNQLKTSNLSNIYLSKKD